MSITRIVELQREILSEVASKWYSDSDTIAADLRKLGSRIQPSRYGYRRPIETYPGGAFAKADFDGGALTRSGQGNYTKLRAGYYNMSFGFEYTLEQKRLAMSNIDQFKSFTQKVSDNAMKLFETHMNILFFMDGTGRLTSSASAHSSGTYTFAAAGDKLGTFRVPIGCFVDVWDTTGATKRSGGPFQVIHVDNTARTVTLNATPSGAAATDLLAIPDLDIYGPATSTGGNSTYPGSMPFTGAGIGGDSFVHGIDYALDDNSSSYYFGVQRSTHLLGLQPTTVDASASLTFNHMAELKARMSLRHSTDVWTNWRGFMSPGHNTSLANLIQTTQLITVNGDKAQMVDNYPKVDYGYGSPINIDGIPVSPCRYTKRDVVQCFNPKDFAMIGLDPEYFEGHGAGPTLMMRNASGAPLTKFQIFLLATCEYMGGVPGHAGLIKNVTPASYA